MKAFSWINVALGLWLIVAAFVFTYTTGMRPATTQEVVLGVAIVALAIWSAIAPPNPLLAWLVALAGLATLVAPMVLTGYHGTSVARTNDAIVGLAVFVLGSVSAIARHRRRARLHA